MLRDLVIYDRPKKDNHERKKKSIIAMGAF